MDFALLWINRAIGDPPQIVRYCVEAERSRAAPRKVGSAILDRVGILRTIPDIGPRYPRGRGNYREVLCFTHRIFHRADHEARIVSLARIWHGTQDLLKLELEQGP